MCRSRRQRKMFYLHCTDRGCTILFSCPSSQTSRHGGRNPMVQRPGRLRPEDCWSPGAGGQHGNIGRLCLQSKQANKPTPNMLQGIFLWPGGRWESFGREKKFTSYTNILCKVLWNGIENCSLDPSKQWKEKYSTFLVFCQGDKRPHTYGRTWAQSSGSKCSKWALAVD